MPLQASLIDRMRDDLHDLNKAERRVIEVVLHDIDAATHITIRDLAQAARVSEPTVVRVARRFGCLGFADFKLRLSQDYAVARMFVRAEQSGPQSDAVTNIDYVYEAAVQALAHSYARRDPVAIEAAATAILKARRPGGTIFGRNSDRVRRRDDLSEYRAQSPDGKATIVVFYNSIHPYDVLSPLAARTALDTMIGLPKPDAELFMPPDLPVRGGDEFAIYCGPDMVATHMMRRFTWL